MNEQSLQPPNSAQAEAGVIGGLMLDNKAWPRVHGLLTHADFYQRRNQILFNSIAKLLAAGDPADVITVHELIKARGHEETVGGLAYIVNLARDTPSAANIATYAAIVRDKSTLRQLLELSGSIREMATEEGANAKTALAKVERQVLELAQRDLRGKKGFSSLKDIYKRVLDRLEESYNKPSGTLTGISTGFDDLDAATSGFNGGDFIIIAGRPAMGKSILALDIAEASARKSGKLCAVFSMEMQDIQLGQRMLSSSSGVGLTKIRESWRLDDTDWPMISAGMVKTGDLPIYIDDTPGLSVSEIRARALRLQMELKDDHPEGVGMIVIDYLQLMGSDNDRAGNRNNEIEDITRALKRLAKELDIPIIALSQLNRSLESRPNKRPLVSDLRDSGGIEQDADIIIFLYRDEVYNKDSADAGTAELIIGKQRNGPLETVRVQFDGPCVRFRNLANGGGQYGYSAR